MKSIPAFLLVFMAHVFSAEQPTPPDGLKFELVLAKKQFQLGEPIEVTMRYTYTGDVKLGVEVVNYDRGGRITDFGFSAKDANGKAAREPRGNGGVGGGLRSAKELPSGGSYEQTVELNEWVAIDTPGKYQITGHSQIVGPINAGRHSPYQHFNLDSAPIEIEIIPFDEAARVARIKSAEAELESGSPETRMRSFRDIWFMQDERAIPALIHCLTNSDSHISFYAMFALQRFEKTEPPMQALLKAIDTAPAILNPTLNTSLARVLTHLELGDRPLTGNEDEQAEKGHATWLRWSKHINDRFLAHSKTLDDVAAANQLVRAMASANLQRDDPDIWKRVLDHAASIDEPHAQSLEFLLQSNFKLVQFIPQLRELSQNQAVRPRVRSGAVAALKNLGSPPERDAIYNDLISPTPEFPRSVHATLGDYKLKERTAALLKLAHGEHDQTLGTRIRDFATAASAEELRATLGCVTKTNGQYLFPPVLTALAHVSPVDAVAVISEQIALKPKFYWMREHAVDLLARIDAPEAKRLEASLLNTLNGDALDALLRGLDHTAYDARPPEMSDSPVPERKLMPIIDVARVIFPELLDWLIAHPGHANCLTVRRVLKSVSRIPKDKEMMHVSDTEADTFPPLWSQWWDEHKKEIDRSWVQGK